MDDMRVGRMLRAMRHRRGLRQSDVAAAARISQSLVSLVERGHLRPVSIGRIQAMFAALDAQLDLGVRWRGGDVDRLLDERHARLVGAVANLLRRCGADVAIEVSFNHFGDRGSIDVLASWRSPEIVLVVEVKTLLLSAEETIRRLDVKTRLAVEIARERFGWPPRVVARLLVLGEANANRRRLARHASLLDVTFPLRGREARQWLRTPSGPMSGLIFLPISNPETPRHRNRAN